MLLVEVRVLELTVATCGVAETLLPHLIQMFVRCEILESIATFANAIYCYLLLSIAILVFLVEVQLAEERPTAPILLRLFGRKGIAAIAAL